MNTTQVMKKVIRIEVFFIYFISVDLWSFWVDEAITAEMYSVGSFTDLIG